jgi:hypothetical protein
LSKFFLSRRRAVAAGVAIATVIGFSAASTIATNASAVAKTSTTTTVTSASMSASDPASFNVTAVVTAASSPTKSVSFTLWSDSASCAQNDQGAIKLNGGNGKSVEVGLTSAGRGTYTASASFTAPAASTYFVRADYPGDSNNGKSSASCVQVTAPVQVAAATTTTWATPNPITEGTSLAGLLDATVASNGAALSIPGDGTIAYTEGAATLSSADTLSVGSHTLTATFTPSQANAAKYAPSSADMTLTVNAAPVATAPVIAQGGNPADLTVAAGQTASFTASATGNPTPDVQWWVCSSRWCSNAGNWSKVSVGGQSTTLSFTATKADDGNQYRAVFKNSAGSVTSASATLTVNSAPAVTNQPDDETVNAGDNASFQAAASGSPSPSIKWQVSTDGTTWTDIPGGTHSTLSLHSVQASDNGNQYRAVFTNNAGSVTSDAATLTVDYAPTVTTDPTDQTAAEGTTATFTAAATGNPAPSVQWQQYVQGWCFLGICIPVPGVWTWQDIPGATGTTLTLSNVTLGMDGNQYRAEFSNGVWPHADSQSATLHVTALTVVTPSVNDITVTQATCAAPAPSITFGTVSGITYSTNPSSGYGAGQQVTVTATLASGYKFGTLPSGWTATDAQDATYTVTLDPMPDCTALPAAPTIVNAGCDANHQPTAPSATLPADGNHVSYRWYYAPNANGFVAKATLDAGYSWGSLAGTNWQDKGSGNAAYHYVWPTAPDCNVYVTPDVPQLSETCEIDGNGHQTGNVFDSVLLPTDTSDIHYAEHNGTLYAVIQQSVKAYTYFQTLPAGWAFDDGAKHQYVVFTPTYTNPTCLIDTAPVAPTVSQAVCTGPGTSSPATVVDPDGNGVTYTIAQDLSSVTATLDSGYQWQKGLPTGWTAGPGNTLVYDVTLIPAGACLVDTTPVTPAVQAGTCDMTTGFDSPAAITSPADKQDLDDVTYFVSGLTVTAVADPGYQIASVPTGWVTDGGIWTYTANVTQPFCPSVIPLPDSVPGTPDGALDGVPGTTNPGQQLDVTGTGFAPGATVNFGIYSTPLLLATVSADASGTAKATVVIPADFIGDHTVVAAGSTSAGTAQFLAAKTTVVKKVTPAGNGGGLGVGGVSASRGPGVGPNGGSSSGLANTGARVNPVALTQIALLALLAGGGLLVATRRRARKH